MWAIVHTPPQKNTHEKTEYTTFPEKILRLQIAITAVCSLDSPYILTNKSVKLRKIHIFQYNLHKIRTFLPDMYVGTTLPSTHRCHYY